MERLNKLYERIMKERYVYDVIVAGGWNSTHDTEKDAEKTLEDIKKRRPKDANLVSIKKRIKKV